MIGRVVQRHTGICWIGTSSHMSALVLSGKQVVHVSCEPDITGARIVNLAVIGDNLRAIARNEKTILTTL